MADHKIQIDVNIAAKQAVSELKSIRSDLDDIQKHSHLNVSISANTANAVKSINELRNEIAQFASLGAEMNSANVDFLDAKFQQLLDKIDELNGKHTDVDVNSDAVEEATSRVDRLVSALDVASGVASSLSTVFSGLGDFGGLFADAFGGMASMFQFDTLGTSKRYLTAMATKAVTSQISGILERYDIMNTFVPYMELANVDRATAEASLNAVDLSIRGIPIGLDEAAFRLRKYQMYLGDIERATKFTIGIQKAITAGGASEQMKTTAYTQIDRLLATGKLGQSRQWLSLFNGMGVSLKFLREELNLDPTADLKTVAADLANGTIATEDFIDAITRLADNPGLDQAIGIYKGTIEAWRSNINNAIKRGGQNILENINSVLEDVYGQGITGFMKNVRDGIDTVSKEAGTYIKENPQNVQIIGDSIGGLVDRVTTLDGGRFVENFVTNLGHIADTVGQIFDSIPPGFIEDFTAFATTWAGPMAAVMKAAQSGLPFILGIFEGMKDWDMGALMQKITDEIGRMAGFIGTIMGALPEGFMGDLMAFGLVWGRPLANVLSAVSGALKDISGGLQSEKFSGANGIMGQLSWLVYNQPVIAAVGAAIAAIAFGISQVYKAERERDQKTRELLDLDKLEEDLKAYEELSNEIQQHAENYQENLDKIHASAEMEQGLVDEIFQLYDDLQSLEGPSAEQSRLDILEKLAADIQLLQELEPGIDLSQLLTGDIDTSKVQALRDMADAYVDMVEQEARAEAAKSALTQAYEDQINAQKQRSDLEKQAEEYARQADLYNKAFFAERDLYTQRAIKRGDYVREEDGTLTPQLSKKETERLKDLNKYATEAATAYAEIETTIKGVDLSDEELAERIEYLKGVWLGSAQEMNKSARTVKKSMDDINGTAEEIIGDGGKKLDAIMSKVGEVIDKSEKAAKTARKIKEETQEIITAYKEAKDAAQQWIDTALAGYEKMEAAGPETDENGNPKETEGEWLSGVWNGMIEGEKSQVSEAGRYRSALNTIDEWIWGLDEESRKRYAPMVEEILTSPWDDREMTLALAEKIKSGDWASIMELANKQLEEAALASDISDTVAHALTADETEGGSIFDGLFDTVSTGLLQVMSDLTESAGAEGELGQATSEFTETLLQPFEEGLMGSGEESGGDGVVGLFKEAMEHIQESAGELADTVSEALAPITAGFEESTDGSHILESAIVNLGSTATAKAGEMEGFAGSLDSVASSASNAFSNVSALAAAISRLQSKEITIRVNVIGALGMGFVGSGSGSSSWLSPLEGVMSHGGPVGYFAGGGFPGIGRGTDTIPAWLTPGEYVMKRSAVGLFGTRLMDRINKMDIGGAFDALMSRISNPMMHGNTYNRDNHAQVINNFYGNGGQDYSQRKAYRYVGSL